MLKPSLQIAIIQSDIVWENPEKNIAHFNQKFKNLPLTTDLVILPEMFTTGFSMNPHRLSETMNGQSVSWMQQWAIRNQIAICGSLIISEQSNYYNRFVFVYPNGEIKHYNKRHLFSIAGEHKMYTAGSSQTIVNYKEWKLSLQICYDLRFPVWSRQSKSNYDALIYVASWPTPRIHAWDTLLKARAIENMCYCIGANRVGKDANGHAYPGPVSYTHLTLPTTPYV